MTDQPVKVRYPVNFWITMTPAKKTALIQASAMIDLWIEALSKQHVAISTLERIAKDQSVTDADEGIITKAVLDLARVVESQPPIGAGGLFTLSTRAWKLLRELPRLPVGNGSQRAPLGIPDLEWVCRNESKN